MKAGEREGENTQKTKGIMQGENMTREESNIQVNNELRFTTAAIISQLG